MVEEDVGDEEGTENKNTENVLSLGDPKREKPPNSAQAARQTG
jgi:hypothetical protein